jgi:hypothetical protein
MGPAVRRTRPQSRITAAPVQDPNYSGPKVGVAGAVRSNLALIVLLPGTEFLDAETGRQKSSRKNVNACRDQSPGSKCLEIPAEAPNLASTRERVACGDWMVVCAVIYEPVSSRSCLITAFLQGIFPNLGLLWRNAPGLVASFQCLRGKFPTIENRTF